jgi:hypothetical protein
MKRFLSILVLVLVVSATGVFTNSCNKPKPCKGTITVYDSAGNFQQSGVVVKLYSNVTTPSGGTATADLKWEGVTDSYGTVTFTFKLPAIMDIKAERPNCTPNVATHNYCVGTGIIKLEEGKTIEKKVRLVN